MIFVGVVPILLRNSTVCFLCYVSDSSFGDLYGPDVVVVS